MSSNQTIARGWAAVLAIALATSAGAQKSDKTPRSLSQIEAAIKRDPTNPKLRVALGLAYWDKNDYPRALEAFQRAVKLGPTSAETHNWLGVAIMEKADLPRAIGEFRKAIALDPKYVDVIVQRWQTLSGKQATLDGDGRTFGEICQERMGATT